jgi:RHS repeat-associated protein
VDIQYDALGRRTLLTLPNGVSTEYAYDPGSRLSALVYRNALGPLGDLSYQYDAAGNRIATGGLWARTGIPAPVPSSTYDQANEQLASGDVTQTFDPNGNLLTQTDASGTTTYTWDARNRLIGINSPTLTASFTYDALGRRISKTIDGAATTFHYDRLDIVRETGSAGDAAYLRTLRIDEALARRDPSGTLAYVADALGSTIALADSSAALTTEYTYEPFGRTDVTGSSSVNSFQFTGRENDGTGLYYFRARYQHAGVARFLSEDPLNLQVVLRLIAAGTPVGRCATLS